MMQEIICLSLNQYHLARADEWQVADTWLAGYKELQVCIQIVETSLIWSCQAFNSMSLINRVCLCIDVIIHHSKNTKCIVILRLLCEVKVRELILCQEVLLTDIIIRDAGNQLMTDGSSTCIVTFCCSIVTITSILCTKRPIPVVFCITTITTHNPLRCWLTETSLIISIAHQWITLLSKLSLIKSCLVILAEQSSTCINSMSNVCIRNPNLRSRTIDATFAKQGNRFLAILVNLIYGFCQCCKWSISCRFIKTKNHAL